MLAVPGRTGGKTNRQGCLALVVKLLTSKAGGPCPAAEKLSLNLVGMKGRGFLIPLYPQLRLG